MRIGPHYVGKGRCEFTVWSPASKRLAVRLVESDQLHEMEQDRFGYWRVELDGVRPDTLYLYRINDSEERPDPAANSQPRGVHGPSQVVDHSQFAWGDGGWRGVALEEMILYELHVGAFTPAGTFEAIIGRLDDLREVGVNAIELMPVAQFPGGRNWGYDGAFPFAAQNSYGGPAGLKRLVDACHRAGLSVVLDVVYNHLGPEGNYLGRFAPYFTEKYRTPWGNAINFDDAYSDGVRNYFIENALYWLSEFHVDALRLDAVHAIYDMRSRHFLAELADAVAALSTRGGRKFYLIAESDLNDVRLVQPREAGGYGLDAQWCDDFHHSLRALLTGERTGYYSDFGSAAQLAKAFKEGFVYSGEYSGYRLRSHGSSSADVPAGRFVAFTQNHDQIGNRMFGERLAGLVPFEALKLAAGAVMISPYVPMLFMGEEYGEPAPFLYFVSHGDADLIKSVREGRKEEFKSFAWQGEPPDPQSAETFSQSKLGWERRGEGKHKTLLEFYRELIRLRANHPALAGRDKTNLEASVIDERVLACRRWRGAAGVFCLMNFNGGEARVKIDLPRGAWTRILDSSEERWGGPGSRLPARIERAGAVIARPQSFAVYSIER